MNAIAPHVAARSDPYFGRMYDLDGHIYLPIEMHNEIDRMAGHENSISSFYRRYLKSEEYKQDVVRNRDDLFAVKGMAALGAVDPVERIEAQDLMGAKAQLTFGGSPSGDTRVNSDQMRNINRMLNDFYIDWCKQTQGRNWPVIELNMTEPQWAMEELDRVLKKGGVGAIGLPCAEPPGGVSPAHSTWDPFWARLQEANVPAVMHLGGGGLISLKDPDPMLPERAWGNAESLKVMPAERGGGEEAVSPYFLLVAHIPPEIYLQTMVMGRVFERFPDLRFGIFEYGTAWIGPCVERMDMWAGFQAKVLGRKFEMMPSEYVKRNVRFGPFFHEDVRLQLERYGLHECYCYSTDYPHLEGSKDPIGKFREKLHGLPEKFQEDFFINNAKWLMPYVE